MALPEDEKQRTLEALKAADWRWTEAAKVLGIDGDAVRKRAKNWGLQKPDDDLKVVGQSTLRDTSGNVVLEWTKTAVDRERHEQLMREAIAALASDIKPASKTPTPFHTQKDLLVAYQIGDAHIGSYSWGPECNGGNFDLAIAEEDLMAAVDRLIASTPPADTAVIVNVGDWFHTDTSKPFTPLSGNLLDTDSRWPKVIASGVRVQREMCRRALMKHKKVILRNTKGNHDPHSSTILDVAMRAYFEHESRLVVEDSPRDLWHMRFGSNLIGVTHGHNIKPENLPGVLAVDAREDWGQCEFRHIWCGHFHAKRYIDVMGTRVTVWPTLAANDKWHSDKGYRSNKEMCAVVMHKDYGVTEEHTAGLKLIRDKSNVRRERAA